MTHTTNPLRGRRAALSGLAVALGLAAWAPARAGAVDPAPAGDAAAGQQVFKACVACHTVAPGGTSVAGPNLFAIVGRDIASAPKFAYSDALKSLPGAWDAASLDRFLANPTGVAPGTRMVVRVADPKQRADLVAYLASLREGSAAAAAAAAPADFGPGWPAGPGQAETGQLCSACHSLAIVKAQRLPRERWEKLFDWMIDEQGMAAQPPEQRKLMVDYLATHFGAPK